MKCDIYKSGSLRNAYLFVLAGSEPQTNVPSNVLTQLGALTYLKSIEFSEDSPLIAADSKEVIENIQKQGFHVQGAEVRSEVSEAGAAIGGGILGASLGLGPVGAIAGAVIGVLLATSAKGDKK